MEIQLKLSKDFERFLEEMKQKYGEDFEYINGIHPSQLDFSEFIDNFIDKGTLADSSIDPNANANHRDIRSFMTEKAKSEDKLFGLNKIFTEIKKMWGLRTAKQWFEQEFSKGFYLNDSTTASYFPYCYKGENLATYKYNGNVFCCSFVELYDLLIEPEIFDASINQCAKFPENLYVLDIADGEQLYTKVLRVVKHHNDLPMHVLKTANGITQIVTANHPVITENGDVSAEDVTEEDHVCTVVSDVFDGSKTDEVCGMRLTSNLGWLVGMAMSEGWFSGNTVFIGQDEDSETGKKLKRVLDCLGAPYSVYGNRKFNIKESSVKQFIKYFIGNNKSFDKKLPNEFIHYPDEFLSGYIAGMADGDGTFCGSRNILIRVTSNVLIRQLSMILSHFGLIGRELIPYSGSGIGNSHKTVYGISFRVRDSMDLSESIKYNNCFVESERNLNKNSSLNKKYSSELCGFSSIINNSEFIEECEEVYDITTSSGHFICNNILSHNCWANDFTRLAKEGLFFLNGNNKLKRYNNEPPKHLTTYFDDVIEFVSFLSNRQSGAVGLPNVLIWAWYFWKKDVEDGYYMKDPDYYLRQQFQKFIYRLNQPFLRIDQSAFTNISIFDRPYLESLFGGTEFPDGTFAIDHIEDFIGLQKVFMKVVSDIRKTNMFTYPVLTYSLLYVDNKFVDEDFARWCSNHNIEWSDSNFFVSDNVGVLSNCPVSADTKILYWSDYYNQFKLSPIKEVYFNRGRKDSGPVVKVLSNGKVIDCKINKFEDKANYLITLTNGATLRTTANHLNKVYGKDYVLTKNLTTDDYLPYSLKQYKSNDFLTYEEGKVVGMFLGDGSYRNKSDIVFSLNSDTDKDDIGFIERYCSNHFGAKIYYNKCISQISGNSKCVNVCVCSDYLRGLISQFVIGDCATNKELNLRVLNCSVDFRRGIVDGLYTTDGNKSSEDCNRIYTSSEKLKDSLVVLFASLGVATKIYVDNREGRLSDDCCYTIRWFTPNGRTKRKDSYIVDDDYMWIKIKSIEIVDNAYSGSYCLEVLSNTDEPVFMLGNGIVTHNCRLLSNTKKLDAFINSIGGTALSVGSCRVSTINLVRIAYESQFNKKKYLKILRDRTLLNCKALTSMRHIIKRNIEKGLLPNYQDGAVELDKQFCTIGIIGNFEVMDLFGFIHTDEFGCKSYSDDAVEFTSEILDTINDVKDNFECDFTFNVEAIPAENCAGVICNADNILFEQDKYFIYSNQWIPLMEKCTIQEKCRLGSLFDKKCGGGCIAHINIENRFPNEETAWDMLNYVASQGVIYFAFTTKINVCESNHSFIGTKTCPVCGGEIKDTYARVVGFYTPVSNYQKIRKVEFDKRKWMNVLSSDGIMS